MLHPANAERINLLVSRANQEFRWAVNNKYDQPRLAINIREVKMTLKDLILPSFPGVIGEEFAVQFVNGSTPAQAFDLTKNTYDMASIQPGNDIAPHEAVKIRRWAESNRYLDTYFGTERLVGLRAMLLSVEGGGKLQVNEDGLDEWLETYHRIYSQATLNINA